MIATAVKWLYELRLRLKVLLDGSNTLSRPALAATTAWLPLRGSANEKPFDWTRYWNRNRWWLQYKPHATDLLRLHDRFCRERPKWLPQPTGAEK